jgi:GNAT superfamily N-acetyltransferase
MTLLPHEGDPALRRLVDDSGRSIAVFREVDRISWLQCDVVSVDGPVDAVAAAFARERPGWRVATADEGLAEALVTAGGGIRRHLHQLEYDVRGAPPDPSWSGPQLPGGLAVAPFHPVTPDTAATWLVAYPPDHPDHDPEVTDVPAAVADLQLFADGKILGPLLTAVSAVAVARDGRVAGGVVVVDAAGEESWSGGPWVIEVFTHPRARGQGIATALLRRAVAVAADAGFDRVGLSVTDGNPARSTYERVGFVRTASARSIELPAEK